MSSRPYKLEFVTKKGFPSLCFFATQNSYIKADGKLNSFDLYAIFGGALLPLYIWFVLIDINRINIWYSQIGSSMIFNFDIFRKGIS